MYGLRSEVTNMTRPMLYRTFAMSTCLRMHQPGERTGRQGLLRSRARLERGNPSGVARGWRGREARGVSDAMATRAHRLCPESSCSPASSPPRADCASGGRSTQRTPQRRRSTCSARTGADWAGPERLAGHEGAAPRPSGGAVGAVPRKGGTSGGRAADGKGAHHCCMRKPGSFFSAFL